MKEEYPLKWPEGYTRTLLNDREAKNQWQKGLDFYIAQLDKELKHNDVVYSMLTRNTGPLATRDPGAALYFSRKAEPDFSWQLDLNIHDPNPTVEMIDTAFRSLAARHHPDRGGDIEIFKKLTVARDRAKRWAENKENTSFDYVIPCDRFREVKWNVNAIKITLNSLRRIEEAGSPVLLERAFKGFQQIAEHSSVIATHA